MKPFAMLFLIVTLLKLSADSPADRVPVSTNQSLASRAVVGKPNGATNEPGSILYKPPRVNAPRVSTGPGTRGSNDQSAPICVLAPDHAALTTVEQPDLYWYQANPGQLPVEVTLVAPGEPDPLLQLLFASPPAGQLQRIDLKQHRVLLQPGIDYKWSVAVVVDSARRSKDLVASGVVKRIPLSSDLAARLKTASPAEKALIYAAEGIWYDALAAALDHISVRPSDPQLREQAAALNRQIGLTNVAAFCLTDGLGRSP